MAWTFRSCVLAASAAALLSTQAAYAAPVPTAPVADPLVSLSVLATAQSRAAVCGTGTACILPSTMGATATTSPALPAAASAAAMQGPGSGKQIDPLVVGIGVAVFIGLIILLLSGGDDGDGNLAPISPQ